MRKIKQNCVIEIDSVNMKEAKRTFNQMIRKVLSDKEEPVMGRSRFVVEDFFNKHCFTFI